MDTIKGTILYHALFPLFLYLIHTITARLPGWSAQERNTMKTKNTNYGNRGMALEEIIKYSIEHYQYREEAIIAKVPTEFIPIRNAFGKVTDVKVEHKSIVDFIGHYKGIPVAFEAKNTNTNRIYYTAVQPHQAAFLDKWHKQGCAAFVVVAFNKLHDFYRIPWYFWKANMKNDKRQRGTPIIVKIMGADGNIIEWKTSGKASFAPQELPDFWRIKADNVYRLPFLDGLMVEIQK